MRLSEKEKETGKLSFIPLNKIKIYGRIISIIRDVLIPKIFLPLIMNNILK